MNFKLLLFLINNLIVPFKTDTLGIFDIWSLKHSTVLIFDLNWIKYLNNLVRHVINQVISLIVLVDVTELREVIHYARTCCILRQISQNDATPLILSEAARIICKAEFNWLFRFIEDLITLGFEDLVDMLKGSWILELYYADCR